MKNVKVKFWITKRSQTLVEKISKVKILEKANGKNTNLGNLWSIGGNLVDIDCPEHQAAKIFRHKDSQRTGSDNASSNTAPDL